MDDTPGRKTRVARTSATPAPSTAGGRRSRPKTNRALPAVPTAKSHAYGSTGKVELTTQLDDPSGSGQGFAARFAADRGAGVGRRADETSDAPVNSKPTEGLGAPVNRKSDEGLGVPAGRQAEEGLEMPAANHQNEESATRAAPVIQRRTEIRATSAVPTHETVTRKSTIVTSRTPSKPRPVPASVLAARKITAPQYSRSQNDDIEEDDDIDDFPEHQDDYGLPNNHSARQGSRESDSGDFTDLDTNFSYTTSMPPSARSNRRVTITRLQPPPTTEEREAAEPWSMSIFLETIHRRLRRFEESWKRFPSHSKRLCLGLLAALALLIFFGPSGWASLVESGADVCHKAGEYAMMPFGRMRLGGYGSVNDDLSKRLRDVESQMRSINHQVHDLNPDEFRKLQHLLPDYVMVKRNEKTGQFEFPPNFWHALQEKLDERDTESTWDTFIEANKKKLEQHAENVVENTLKHQHVVSRDMLTALVQESHAEFSKKFASQLRAFEEHSLKKAEIAARKTVTDIVKSGGKQKGTNQLQSLALANIARNTELRLGTVNFFSHTLGATVIPRYTSPTSRQQLNGIWQWIGRNAYNFAGRRYPSAANALTPWEEPADCWCAAASDKMGSAQIGVLLPRAMKPTSITFEHMPMTGTLDIAAAPKEFEVWVRSKTGAMPSDVLHSRPDCGEAPDHNFVCVGKAAYDIKALNHVQNFDLEDMDDAFGYVDLAIVRVKNNWGQDWTCIYRVRLHGEPEPMETGRSFIEEL